MKKVRFFNLNKSRSVWLGVMLLLPSIAHSMCEHNAFDNNETAAFIERVRTVDGFENVEADQLEVSVNEFQTQGIHANPVHVYLNTIAGQALRSTGGTPKFSIKGMAEKGKPFQNVQISIQDPSFGMKPTAAFLFQQLAARSGRVGDVLVRVDNGMADLLKVAQYFINPPESLRALKSTLATEEAESRIFQFLPFDMDGFRTMEGLRGALAGSPLLTGKDQLTPQEFKRAQLQAVWNQIRTRTAVARGDAMKVPGTRVSSGELALMNDSLVQYFLTVVEENPVFKAQFGRGYRVRTIYGSLSKGLLVELTRRKVSAVELELTFNDKKPDSGTFNFRVDGSVEMTDGISWDWLGQSTSN